MDEVHARLSRLRLLWSQALDASTPIESFSQQARMLEPVVRELQVVVERMEARREELLREMRQKQGRVEAGVRRSGIGWVARRGEEEDVNLPVSLRGIDADLHLLERLESEVSRRIAQLHWEIQESVEGENLEDLAGLGEQGAKQHGHQALVDQLCLVTAVHTDIVQAMVGQQPTILQERMSSDNDQLRDSIAAMNRLLRLHDDDMANWKRPRLKQRQRELRTVVTERTDAVVQSTQLITHLGALFNEAGIKAAVFEIRCDDLSEEYIAYLGAEKERLVREHETRCRELCDRQLAELIGYWDALGRDEAVRASFMAALRPVEGTLDGLHLLVKEASLLRPLAERALRLCAAISDRLSLIQRMKEFERTASDPARLFRSSFQLNQEERFRKNALPTLLTMEKRLVADLMAFESDTNEAFIYKGHPYLQALQADIAGRYVNETVFGFESHARAKLSTRDESSLSSNGAAGGLVSATSKPLEQVGSGAAAVAQPKKRQLSTSQSTPGSSRVETRQPKRTS